MSTVNNTETTTSSGDCGAGVEPWGTLEELLLACAVNRHGADSWDSIAKELQNRTGLTKTDENENENDDNRVIFTALNCKEKYEDLKRRFNLDGTGSGDGQVDAGAETDDGRDEFKWMVNALRKLRVEELKREVQRRDASIVSLELKVKRLEEEREKTSKTMVDDVEGGADLIVLKTNGNGSRSPAASGDGGGSDEIDDDDRSFNESNSTSQKDNNDDESNRDPAADEVEDETGLKTEPVSDSKTEPDRIHEIYVDGPGGDRSYSGGLGIFEAEMSAASRLGESNELRDSVSESKGEVKGAAKQNNSDVQSSASLSKRKRRGWRGGGGGGGVGSSSGDEVGAEELSPADRLIGVKSRPLIGSWRVSGRISMGRYSNGGFQETGKYRNLILQHMDLDTIQSKLDGGIYSDSHMTFYRDLLLVFTNAILFYRKSSAEHIAARELRKLVKQEITRKTRTSKPFKPEPELHLLDSIVKKPRSATTTIICRRRATTPPKPLPLDDQVEEKKDNGLEQKPKAQTKVQPKKAINQLNDNGDHKVKEKKVSVTMPKKLAREKPPTMVNNTKKTSTTNNNKKNKNKEVKQDDHSNDSRQESDSKKEKQAKATSPATKKQGVANFLRRMKQNSPAREAGEEDETESEKDGGDAGGETRSKEKEKVDNKKAGMVRRTSGRMQGKDPEKDTGKRVAGRPPKRKAAKGATESLAAATKRKREGDSGGSGGRQKKKSRK
ncbi:hypothetical protein AKJ16_DCAP10270 [Drosera capensis]